MATFGCVTRARGTAAGGRRPRMCAYGKSAIERLVACSENLPDTGSCWNCEHWCTCAIEGVTFDVCARGRDTDASDALQLAQIKGMARECRGWRG